MEHDARLLEKYARNQDPNAFAEIVQRYAAMVYGTSLRITKNKHDAEDVSQECFMKLAQKASAITISLPSWLHTVATTRSLQVIRNISTRHRYEGQAMAANDTANDPT